MCVSEREGDRDEDRLSTERKSETEGRGQVLIARQIEKHEIRSCAKA